MKSNKKAWIVALFVVLTALLVGAALAERDFDIEDGVYLDDSESSPFLNTGDKEDTQYPSKGYLRLLKGRVVYRDRYRKEQLGWVTEDSYVYAVRVGTIKRGAYYELRFDTQSTENGKRYEKAYVLLANPSMYTGEKAIEYAQGLPGARIVDGVPIPQVRFHYGEIIEQDDYYPLVPAVGRAVIVKSGVNLRKGPGKSFSRVIYLKKGQEISILGSYTNGVGDRWIFVRTEGGDEGFVAKDTLELLPNPTPTPVPEETAQPEETPVPGGEEQPEGTEPEGAEGEPEEGEDAEPTEPEIPEEPEEESVFGGELHTVELQNEELLTEETLGEEEELLPEGEAEDMEETAFGEEELLEGEEIDPEAELLEGEELLEEEEAEEAGVLSANLWVEQWYAREEDEVLVRVPVTGGAPGYTAHLTVSRSGDEVFAEELTAETAEEPFEFTFKPEEWGVYRVRVAVTDAEGVEVKAEGELPVASRKQESEAAWAASAKVELTGDAASDIVAVARTQVGYEESKENFAIAEDGGIDGYTRYGAFYGTPYAEWCSLFVAFTLHYAEVPFAQDFRQANVGAMREKAQSRGAYRTVEEYAPQAGDLVFVTVDGNPVGHMGIVSAASEGGIETIQGNVRDSVVEKSYALDDEAISGYVSIATLAGEPAVEEPETLTFSENGITVEITDGMATLTWETEGEAPVAVQEMKEDGYRVITLTGHGVYDAGELEPGEHTFRLLDCTVDEEGVLNYTGEPRDITVTLESPEAKEQAS